MANRGEQSAPHEEGAPMSDALLEWMSYRHEGRVGDIPAELHGWSVWRLVDNLSTLGHIELDNDRGWRVAPPVLAGLPSAQASSEQTSVLCGARTAGVLAALARSCSNAGAQMHVEAVRNQPSRVLVVCPSRSVLTTVAAGAKIALQHDAAYTLLACLPTVRNWPRTPCALVAGAATTVKRFSRRRMQWIASSLPEAASAKSGFFRIKRDWDWVSILKLRGADYAYIDDRAGRLFTAAKLRVASWTAASQVLSLPIQLYPPTLIARALALCSGVLPEVERTGGRLLFAGVSPSVLRLTLSITGLRLA
jgi:hypothetical protein